MHEDDTPMPRDAPTITQSRFPIKPVSLVKFEASSQDAIISVFLFLGFFMLKDAALSGSNKKSTI